MCFIKFTHMYKGTSSYIHALIVQDHLIELDSSLDRLSSLVYSVFVALKIWGKDCSCKKLVIKLDNMDAV